MLIPISLRTRLICMFIAMSIIVLTCSIGLLWHANQINRMFGQVVNKDMTLYKITQDLELALANQKGFLTYYFVDGNNKWLTALNQYREIFRNSLRQAMSFDLPMKQRETLNKIDTQYATYIVTKDAAIEKYRAGDPPISISDPHEKQRDVFFSLLELCRNFSQEQWLVIQEAEKEALAKSARMRTIAWLSISFLSASVF